MLRLSQEEEDLEGDIIRRPISQGSPIFAYGANAGCKDELPASVLKAIARRTKIVGTKKGRRKRNRDKGKFGTKLGNSGTRALEKIKKKDCESDGYTIEYWVCGFCDTTEIMDAFMLWVHLDMKHPGKKKLGYRV